MTVAHAVPDADHGSLVGGGTAEMADFPCSVAQEGFWILDQIDPGTPALNVAVRWQVDGPLSVDLLERAFQGVIDRHEVLRTSFHHVGGSPVQRVSPVPAFRIPEVDLAETPSTRRDLEAMAIAKAEASTPFRLSEAPLLRARLLRLSCSRSTILVTAHHMVCDGWSVGIIAREVGLRYAALRLGTAPPVLPPLVLQYADYSLWQAEWVEAGGPNEQAAFWRDRLSGMRRFEVLPDHPRPLVRTTGGNIVSLLLPRAPTDGLQAIARRCRSTMFPAALAALAVVLQRYTGEVEVTVGTQVAGRDEVELEHLVGVFINTLVLRLDLSGNPTFAEHVARVRDVVQDALGNQHVPMEHVISMLRPARDLGRNPLFSVNFIFQRSFVANASYADVSFTDLPSITPGALYDLNFFMVERPDGWRISCEYDTDLFETTTVEGLLGAFRLLLAGVVAEPDRAISSYAMMTESDRARLVAAAPRIVMPPALSASLPAAIVSGGRHYVVERSGQLAIPNAVGELWLEMSGGASSGIPDPFGSDSRRRLHRSGALVRLRHDGVLEAVCPATRRRAPTSPGPIGAEARFIAPDDRFDVIERRLTAIWAEILGIPSVGLNENFFDLGGHSLLAARMLSRVEGAFGRRPSLAALFSSPTVRAFATLLRPAPALEAWKEFEVVPVNTSGNRVPVFAINNSGLFHHLSCGLGVDQPFLALSAYDPAIPEDLAPETIEAVAARYIGILRRVRPNGPYILLGLCVAGVIAFEMARQLTRDGEQTPLVVVMEAWAPGHLASRSRRDALLAEFSYRFQNLSVQVVKLLTGRVGLVAFMAHRGFAKALRKRLVHIAHRAGFLHSVEGDPYNTWFQSHLEAAARAYRPEPYDGRIQVFHSPEQPSGRFLDPTFGWGALARCGITVHAIPGDHLGIFAEPGVGTMAVHLRRALDEACQVRQEAGRAAE